MTTTVAPATQLSKPQRQRLTLRKLFEQQKPELSKLLPRGMDPERLFRMALSECVKNPDLLECDAQSWALAMQTCASQGLYPDSGLGYMYLIPRSKKVTAQRGYQGDIKLARNTGEISKIGAEVVYQRDHYKVTKGLDPNIEHEPFEGEGDEDPGPLRACYAYAKLTNGEVVFVTLTRRDVMRHKAASTMDTTKASSPWVKHEAAMWKKTAIHELFKWIPKDSEKVEKLARDIVSQPAIDTTAIDLGAAELSIGEQGSELDQVAAELEAVSGGPPEPEEQVTKDGPGCAHPAVPPSRIAETPVGKSVVCPDCGEEFAGEFIDPVAAVKSMAAAAEPEQIRKPRQDRLKEV